MNRNGQLVAPEALPGVCGKCGSGEHRLNRFAQVYHERVYRGALVYVCDRCKHEINLRCCDDAKPLMVIT